MARPRKRKPIKNSDGRYMIHVYCRGVKAPFRRYLTCDTRAVYDRKTADQIYSYLEEPIRRGDLETIAKRLKYFRRVGVDSAQGIMWALDDHPQTAEDWLEEHDPELLRSLCEAIDDDRHHLDELDNRLAKLDAANRADLIEEHATKLIDWCSADTSLLRKIHKQIDKLLNIDSKDRIPDSQKTLSDCFGEWERFKLRTSNAPGDKYVRQIKNIFQKFAPVTGNPPVNKLTKQHPLDWEEYLDRNIGDRGAKSYVFDVFAIKTVITTAIQKTDEKEFDFPQKLERSLELFSVERKAPSKEHKIAMSVDLFHTLLGKAEEHGATDIEAFSDTIEVEPTDGASKMRKVGTIRTVTQKKREGLMWSAIIRLSCNCGCDNADISSITLKDLRLDDDLPLFTLRRMKPAKQVGEPIDRYTPLLPSTVAAIRQWVKYEKPKPDALLFVNDIGNKWEDGKLSHAFRRLREACELPKGVWFKRLRKCGPTLAAKQRKPRIVQDDREAFLGHTVKGTCRFYEDGIGEDLLIDMVNVIGR